MNPAQTYASVDTRSKLESASPHEVISLLLQGMQDKLNQAKFYIDKKDYNQKGQYINKVLDILQALRGSLNFEEGGEIAEQYNQLYMFCEEELIRANTENNQEKIDNVKKVISEIQAGWNGIPESVRQSFK